MTHPHLKSDIKERNEEANQRRKQKQTSKRQTVDERSPIYKCCPHTLETEACGTLLNIVKRSSLTCIDTYGMQRRRIRSDRPIKVNATHLLQSK